MANNSGSNNDYWLASLAKIYFLAFAINTIFLLVGWVALNFLISLQGQVAIYFDLVVDRTNSILAPNVFAMLASLVHQHPSSLTRDRSELLVPTNRLCIDIFLRDIRSNNKNK